MAIVRKINTVRWMVITFAIVLAVMYSLSLMMPYQRGVLSRIAVPLSFILAAAIGIVHIVRSKKS